MTLTTDFGLKDNYVGSMYGSILSINPRAIIIDLSHEVPSYNIVQGATIIGTTFDLFPKGTIHVGVVDPGVGSRRLPILIQTEKYWFVGPDNGLFSMVPLKQSVRAVYALSNSAYFRSEVSHTFHGRDIFAPVAAHLSRGIHPRVLGKRLQGFYQLDVFKVNIRNKEVRLKIIAIDKFGNAMINLNRPIFDRVVGRRNFHLKVGHHSLEGLHRTYSEVPKGKPLLVFGSSGFLEVAMNQGNLAAKWRLSVGQEGVIRVKGS